MKKFITVSILLTYIVFGCLGLFFLTSTDHHHHTNCPFMPGEKTECMMNIFDHATAWKNVFEAIVPIFFILSFFLASRLFLFSIFQFPTSPPELVTFFFTRLVIFVERSEYQIAFSRGILNPKNQ